MIDEGTIKFDSRWRKTDPLQVTEIESLNLWRRPLFAAGFIGHYEQHGIGFGNLSVRAAAGRRFIISGTQTGHIAELGAEQLREVPPLAHDEQAE